MNLGAGQPASLPYGVEPPSWYSNQYPYHSVQFSSPPQQWDLPFFSPVYHPPPPSYHPPPPPSHHLPPPPNPYPTYTYHPYQQSYPPTVHHFIPTNQFVPPHTTHEPPPPIAYPRQAEPDLQPCSIPLQIDSEVPIIESRRCEFNFSDAKVSEFLESVSRLWDTCISKCMKGIQSSEGSPLSLPLPTHTPKIQSSEPKICSPLPSHLGDAQSLSVANNSMSRIKRASSKSIPATGGVTKRKYLKRNKLLMSKPSLKMPIVPSLLSSTVSAQVNNTHASLNSVSDTGTLSFVNNGCGAVDSVFVVSIPVDVSVRQDIPGPNLGENGRECHALHVFDEMQQSDELGNVGKKIVGYMGIRDKGGGLATHCAIVDEYFQLPDKKTTTAHLDCKPYVVSKNLGSKDKKARALAPSKAFTSVHGIVELGDCRLDYFGKGVLEACGNVNGIIGPALIDNDPREQIQVENYMVQQLRRIRNEWGWSKQEFGENVISAVSLYVCKAGANLTRNNTLLLHVPTKSSNSFKLTFSLIISLIELWKYGYVEKSDDANIGQYTRFWNEFGELVKLGIIEDAANSNGVRALAEQWYARECNKLLLKVQKKGSGSKDSKVAYDTILIGNLFDISEGTHALIKNGEVKDFEVDIREQHELDSLLMTDMVHTFCLLVAKMSITDVQGALHISDKAKLEEMQQVDMNNDRVVIKTWETDRSCFDIEKMAMKVRQGIETIMLLFSCAWDLHIHKSEPSYEYPLRLIVEVLVSASYEYCRMYRDGRMIHVDDYMNSDAMFAGILECGDYKMQEFMKPYVTVHSDHEGRCVSTPNSPKSHSDNYDLVWSFNTSEVLVDIPEAETLYNCILKVPVIGVCAIHIIALAQKDTKPCENLIRRIAKNGAAARKFSMATLFRIEQIHLIRKEGRAEVLGTLSYVAEAMEDVGGSNYMVIYAFQRNAKPLLLFLVDGILMPMPSSSCASAFPIACEGVSAMRYEPSKLEILMWIGEGLVHVEDIILLLYCDGVINQFLKYLSSNQLQRSVQSLISSCFGDLPLRRSVGLVVLLIILALGPVLHIFILQGVSQDDVFLIFEYSLKWLFDLQLPRTSLLTCRYDYFRILMYSGTKVAAFLCFSLAKCGSLLAQRHNYHKIPGEVAGLIDAEGCHGYYILVRDDGMMVIEDDSADGDKELCISFLWNMCVYLQLHLLVKTHSE